MSTDFDALALKLEKRTELNTELMQAYLEYSESSNFDEREFLRRAVIVRDYGSGVMELGYSSVQLPKDSGFDSDRESLTDEEKEKRDRANLSRSVRRSRAQVRRKVMAGNLDHMLTLTYRENVTDSKKAFSDFKKFVRAVRVHVPGWAYVCVLEYQKRGACHFHVAVKGWQNVHLLRSSWRAVVGDGNIHLKSPFGKYSSNYKWDFAKLAGYLSKYITKGIHSLDSKQRYRVSEGIAIPEHRFIHEFPKFTDFVAELFDSFGVSCSFHWKEDNSSHGWACSW